MTTGTNKNDMLMAESKQAVANYYEFLPHYKQEVERGTILDIIKQYEGALPTGLAVSMLNERSEPPTLSPRASSSRHLAVGQHRQLNFYKRSATEPY